MATTKFALDVWRSETGRWYVGSPDLIGLLVSAATLKEALAETHPCIIGLWEVLCAEKAKGELHGKGEQQLAAFAPLFAEVETI